MMKSSRTNDVESLEATELRLGLPGTEKLVSTTITTTTRGNKRASSDSDECKLRTGCAHQETVLPPAKTQVVGWPPVRSFRKNTIQARNKAEATETSQGHFVKVSMDGAPYLRKIDLNIYKGYKELRHGLETMFKSFSTGEISRSENGFEFSMAYEDKDGDLMLAGDVPWEMFTSSCKRLRVMKDSEAKGLIPRL